MRSVTPTCVKRSSMTHHKSRLPRISARSRSANAGYFYNSTTHQVANKRAVLLADWPEFRAYKEQPEAEGRELTDPDSVDEPAIVM